MQATVQDNIELGCTIVEKAAVEKAIPEIDEALAHAYLSRRRQRERGMPWIEVPQYPNSRYPSVLPDGLRLQPGSGHQVIYHVSRQSYRPIDEGVRGFRSHGTCH